LPGFTDIFASLDQPVSIFISDDLPTLDLPMNPNSGRDDGGHCFRVSLLFMKVAEWIII
jgi:hypothetical protein